MNIFEVMHSNIIMPVIFCEGNCMTGVSPGAVCGLNSISLECHENLTISSCLCEPGITEGNNCKLTGL